MRKFLNIAKDMSFITLAVILSGIVGLVTLPIYTRLIDPTEFGLYALATATLGFLLMFLPMGIATAAFRFYFEYEKKKSLDKLYGTSIVFLLLFGSIGAIALVAFSGIISSALGADELKILLIIIALIIPFQLLIQLFQNMIRIQERIFLYSISLIVLAYAGAGSGIVLVLLGYSVNGILIGNLIASIVVLSFLLIAERKNISFSMDIKTLKRLESFGFPLIFVNVGAWIIQLSDRYMLQYFCGEAIVGLYSVSYTVAMVIGTFFMAPISLVLSPKFLRIWESGERERTLTTIGSVISLSISVIYLFVWFQQSSFSLREKTKSIPSIFGAAALTNVILNILLIPKFDMMGAAFATLVSYIVLFILLWWKGQRMLKLPYDPKYIGKCVGISVIFLAILLVETEGIILTITKILFAIAVYSALAYKLKLFKPLDII
jgi:O-antigen/teichoic acid export membrane protein